GRCRMPWRWRGLAMFVAVTNATGQRQSKTANQESHVSHAPTSPCPTRSVNAQGRNDTGLLSMTRRETVVCGQWPARCAAARFRDKPKDKKWILVQNFPRPRLSSAPFTGFIWDG